MARTKKEPKAPEKTKEEQLQEIGQCAYSCLAEMVAALECDYERLEELKDERQALQDEVDAISKSADPPDEDEPDHRAALADWDEENAEELKELEEAAGDCESREDAEQRIQEDPLSLEFRSGWVTSRDDMEPEEFVLLLGTGGPAVRIIGEIERGSPRNCFLETQDWFTPWTRYHGQDHAVIQRYCECFCFDF